MTNFSFFFILKKKTKHLTLRRTNWYGNLPYNIREFLWMLWGTCLIWYLEERNLSYVLHGPDEWSTKNARLLQKGKIPPKMEEPLLHWENKNLLIWNSLLECALPYQHSRFLGMSLMVFRIYLHIFVHPIANIPIANSFVWTKSKNNLFFSYLCSKFVLAPPQYGKIEPYSFCTSILALIYLNDLKNTCLVTQHSKHIH